MELAVGTSLVVIAMSSAAGFAGVIGHTPVDWTLGAAISASAVLGSLAGGMLVHRIPTTTLRAAFGWFVVSMALFVLTQEVPGLLGVPASLGLSVAVSALGTGAIAGVRRALRKGRESFVRPTALT
jgi:hypothetical protein